MATLFKKKIEAVVEPDDGSEELVDVEEDDNQLELTHVDLRFGERPSSWLRARSAA